MILRILILGAIILSAGSICSRLDQISAILIIISREQRK